MAETFAWLPLALALPGALLVLLAAVGLLRMPDLLTRMQASSKAGTLGAILVFAAVAVAIPRPEVVVRAGLVILFLFLTAPVAAHAIARAGYRDGIRLARETVVDQLAEDRARDASPAGDDSPA